MTSDKMEYDYTTNQMRLTIDELNIKLEEKSMLLTRAKHAIDALTSENNKMKVDIGKKINIITITIIIIIIIIKIVPMILKNV